MPNPIRKFENLAISKLVHMTSLDSLDGIGLDSEQSWKEILPGVRENRLFLGNYTEDMLWERLEHYGILRKFKKLGYESFKIHLNTQNAEREYFKLMSRTPPCEEPLAELVVSQGKYTTAAPFARELHGKVLPMLFIQWIILQNPMKKEYAADRPRLPGQMHPGSGMGRQVMAMLTALSMKLNLEGITNCPEFPHNAVIYSRRFNYLDPVAQGKLKALIRDLGHYSMADASWGIVLGCVYEKDAGKPFEWFHEDQIFPIGRHLIAYFHSRSYLKTVEKTKRETEFTLDTEKLKTLPRILAKEHGLQP